MWLNTFSLLRFQWNSDLTSLYCVEFGDYFFQRHYLRMDDEPLPFLAFGLAWFSFWHRQIMPKF